MTVTRAVLSERGVPKVQAIAENHMNVVKEFLQQAAAIIGILGECVHLIISLTSGSDGSNPSNHRVRKSLDDWSKGYPYLTGERI